jgi:citrate lyase beta subunit
MTTKSARRSLLFAPASRPDMFAKALKTGADIVCVDLEDAVAPDMKESARVHAFAFLSDWDGAGPERIVRINGLRTPAGLRDLAALVETSLPQGIIMIPKVETAEELRLVDALLSAKGSRLRLAALIESAFGVERTFAIAGATPRLDLIMFGGADLAAETGSATTQAAFAYARSRIVHAARAHGVDVLDVPCLAFRDEDAVTAESRIARELGFTGKAALHPANVPLVNAAFTPSVEEIAMAQRIVAAFEESGGAVASLDGKLVEKPVFMAMQTVLARAKAAGLLS